MVRVSKRGHGDGKVVKIIHILYISSLSFNFAKIACLYKALEKTKMNLKLKILLIKLM